MNPAIATTPAPPAVVKKPHLTIHKNEGEEARNDSGVISSSHFANQRQALYRMEDTSAEFDALLTEIRDSNVQTKKKKRAAEKLGQSHVKKLTHGSGAISSKRKGTVRRFSLASGGALRQAGHVAEGGFVRYLGSLSQAMNQKKSHAAWLAFQAFDSLPVINPTGYFRGTWNVAVIILVLVRPRSRSLE